MGKLYSFELFYTQIKNLNQKSLFLFHQISKFAASS